MTTPSLLNRPLLSAPRPEAAACPAPPRRWHGSALAMLPLLVLAACGGGGGSAPEPIRGPLTVSAVTVVAGDPAGAAFRISLAPGATGPATIGFLTQDLGRATGQASGGANCSDASVDYVSSSGTLVIPAGSSSATVTVALCGNAAFEPTERFELVTNFEGRADRGIGTLLNNTAGGLNDTGLSQCLNSAGALVACGATDLPGQDGQNGRDAQALTNADADGRLGFAYATVGGGCIKDSVTGLTWDPAAPSAATQADAAARVATANAAALCGFTDWRLPSADELLSLVDAGASTAARIDARFAATPAVGFWSATLYAGDTRAAWIVDFGSGAVAYETATNPLAKAFASRLVRGSGPSNAACDDAADTRFVDNGNSTVTDRQTGLMWQQCTDGQSGAACATGGVTSHANFAAALQRASAVNADSAGTGRGFNDWRVPNRNELASLVNRRCGGPTIQRGRFGNTPSISAWTGSPAGASRAWVVDFTDGSIGPGGVTGGRVLRLVRAGT